ncbi:HTH_Tnp_Tc3_2 domain-containing protein [Trichonephila clavipes]|nr:HTH_Tnp_Tc3_2 domain-containing protein [Trichonephila clavipes]
MPLVKRNIWTADNRAGSGRPRQTSRREDRHIVRNTRVQPTASSAAIQTQVVPLPGDLCVFSNHTKTPFEITVGITATITCAAFDTPPGHLRLEWCHARGNWTAAEWKLSLATNPDSISGVMTIVFVCGKCVTKLSLHCYYPSLACPNP